MGLEYIQYSYQYLSKIMIEKKKNEVINLQDYSTFEEVEDIGQKTISSTRVITQKELHDGEKTKFKARLVARGFQESLKLIA